MNLEQFLADLLAIWFVIIALLAVLYVTGVTL